ncbi:amidohydrolase family protein [Microvirga sp. BT689]|uniref:amidohydrolase family protein n=1 Tax=Microvirga arvi TaxID=2778731 RepID=UPI001950DF35|nr:amidohydrolase family protein [Microvirga arvi]MBM6581868.1 amidohydrolase family protein [Microvirga arvi]
MRTLLRVGQMVDGTGSGPIRDAAILIEGERIVAAGRSADIGMPDGARVIEAPAATAIPGLVDVHVHLSYSGSPDKRAFRAELVEMSYPLVALRAAENARNTLLHGFTSVRDMHAPGGTIIDLRDAVNRGYVEGPRIKACGMGLTVTGGHMDQPGWGDHASFLDMTYPCDGPIAFRAGVRAQLKRGADFIKLNPCVSFRKDPDTKPYRFEMNIDEIRAACEEAHEQGVHVGAHTSGGPPLRAAIEAGCDTVEHAHWIDDATLELMVKRGTYLVPTLLVNKTSSAAAAADPETPRGSKRWAELSEKAMWERLDRARRAGVKVAAGSDAGFMLEHGTTNAGEIELLVEGGYSPLEAICAATATGADILEIDAGRLIAGKLADIVLVSGDPLVDISVLRRRENLRVFKGGREVRAPAA